MLNTQKLSALAFALADGKLKDDSKLPPLLKQRLIKLVLLLLVVSAVCSTTYFFSQWLLPVQ
jgi:hypothetical protein